MPLFKLNQRLSPWLFWLWLSTMLGLSLLKSLGYYQSQWQFIESALGGDRMVHTLFAFILAALAVWAFPEKVQGVCFGVFSPVFAALLTGCLAEELSQALLPLRAFSWLDFAASCLGLLLGFWSARCLSKL